ncbi:MAG: MoaD/ThiS family protein [Candidatus Aenigmatarchaeota archaeon]
MQIKVETDEDVMDLEMEEGSTVEAALEEVGINPETVLVERKGEVISESEELKDKDWIKTVSVVSGG